MLDSSALSGLYADTELFRLPDDAHAHNIRFTGENRKGALILCRSASHELPAEEREMLEKMFTALKMKWDDVSLVCTQDTPQFSALKKKIPFTSLVCFGFSPAELSLNIVADSYSLIPFGDIKLIFSEPLSGLKENRENSKDRFWRAMKEMFA